MKKITLLMLIVAMAVSCNGYRQTEQEQTTQEGTDIHIDWQGSYYGVLPCASCPGIKTLITLSEGLKYEKATSYEGEETPPEVVKGTFSWSADGDHILLDGQHYKVQKEQLLLLDANQQEITGELATDYVLQKTELADCSDLDMGYYLHDFKDADGKKYTILYNTNATPPTAIVESEGLNIALTQTKVWAKGATYENEENRLVVQQDQVELYLAKQKTILYKAE